jgi:hypothetical protein
MMHFLAANYRPRFARGGSGVFDTGAGLAQTYLPQIRVRLPAGGLEYNEQPENAIVQFFEETGMQIEVQNYCWRKARRKTTCQLDLFM